MGCLGVIDSDDLPGGDMGDAGETAIFRFCHSKNIGVIGIVVNIFVIFVTSQV